MAAVTATEMMGTPLNQEPLPKPQYDFSRTDAFLVHGAVKAGSDTIRWSAQFPQQLRYDGIAMVLPGYGGIKQTSRGLREAMVEQGVPTVTYEPARRHHGPWWRGFLHPQQLHVQAIEAITDDLRANPVIRRSMPNGSVIDVGRQVLLPHSMGGLAAAYYAERHPDTVEHIVNLAAVGYGHPTVHDIVRIPLGLAASVRHEFVRGVMNGNLECSVRNLRDIIRYYVRLQAVFEAMSCLREDIRPTISRLKDRGKKVGYIAFAHDILVPPHPEVADGLDHHEVLPGSGHLAPQIKARRVAAAILDIHEKFVGSTAST